MGHQLSEQLSAFGNWVENPSYQKLIAERLPEFSIGLGWENMFAGLSQHGGSWLWC